MYGYVLLGMMMFGRSSSLLRLGAGCAAGGALIAAGALASPTQTLASPAQMFAADDRKRVLVTGANKGIGLAISKGLLSQGCHVFLGSRDVGRGEAAKNALIAANPEFKGRIDVVALDVTQDASVTLAAKAVAAKCSGARLHAIVNNAGGAAPGVGTLPEFKAWVDLNLYGPKRVTEAFLPQLETSGGRVVMISSAAGPVFVSKCSEANRAKLTSEKVTWATIEGVVSDAFTVLDTVPEPDEKAREAAFKAAGFGNGYYGLSKACKLAAADDC